MNESGPSASRFSSGATRLTGSFACTAGAHSCICWQIIPAATTLYELWDTQRYQNSQSADISDVNKDLTFKAKDQDKD